jgi:prepilin-type N-terminal cleavage/methylation domain-containing protein
MKSSGRSGFTLIELSVSVGILLLLCAITIPVISMLRMMSQKTATTNFMISLSDALSTYLDQYGHLGDDTSTTGTSFRAAPWFYLSTRRLIFGQPPYMSTQLNRLVTQTGQNACVAATAPQLATHFCDFYGNAPGNVMSFEIHASIPNGTSMVLTQSVDMRSSAGTPSDSSDDLIYHWSNQTSKWDWVKPLAMDPWGIAGVNDSLPGGSPPSQ